MPNAHTRTSNIELTDTERAELTSMARSRSLPAALTLRARIVLACEAVDDERVAGLINKTLHTKPADGSTHWSTRGLAAETGILPMGFGSAEGVTHDYVRHGTTTLFAALNVLNGEVLASCKPRHRHQEFLSSTKSSDSSRSSRTGRSAAARSEASRN